MKIEKVTLNTPWSRGSTRCSSRFGYNSDEGIARSSSWPRMQGNVRRRRSRWQVLDDFVLDCGAFASKLFMEAVCLVDYVKLLVDNFLSYSLLWVLLLENEIRYLDMLPAKFKNPLWFSDDDLQELRGTSLFRATELQVIYLLIDD